MKKGFLVASFWKRGVAYIIDMAILNFIFNYTYKNIFTNLTTEISVSNISDLVFSTSLIMISVFTALSSLIYWVSLEYVLGQSAGKILVGIKVKAVEGKLNLWQCIIRNLTKPFILLVILDSFSLFKTNQRWTESFSGTFVEEEK